MSFPVDYIDFLNSMNPVDYDSDYEYEEDEMDIDEEYEPFEFDD